MRVWPPPDFSDSSQFLAWANKVHPLFSPEEYKIALDMYDRMRKAGAAEQKEQNQPADELDFDLPDDEVVQWVGQMLGASDPRGMKRVEQVLCLHGPEAVWKAARQLVTDGTPRAKWLAFLEYRARMV